MKNKILIFFLLITAALTAQNIDSLESVLYNYKNRRDIDIERMKEIQLKYPVYNIRGDINGIYYEGSVLFIRGIAIPVDGNIYSEGTIATYGNIMLSEPKKENILANSYYNGYHYYLRTTTEKTVYGTATLLKHYGNMPQKDKEILDQEQDEAKILNENIIIIEGKLAKLKSEASLLESQQLYDKGKYYESIDEINTAIKYSPDDKRIYDLLYNNYLAIISQGNNIESCKNIISLLETTLIMPKYTLEQCDHLKNEYAILCIKVAQDYYQNKLYNNAIIYYESAQKYGNSLNERSKKNYSSTYYYQGNNQLEQNLIEDARISYVKAIQIDETISPLVSNQLNSQMKSAFLYTTLSTVLPGMGLTAQGDKRGWIVFGITSISAIGAIIYHNKAMNTPNFLNDDDGARSKNQRDESISTRNIFIVIGAVFYISGIFGTISKVKEYNQKYDLGFNIGVKNISIAMKINF
ncbi:MAG: hypothetical protein RDU14_16840 [Melioribacteraceae bacterium]|nr:hypothetical protein [Melioribacteraceae bacterium]